MEFQQIKTHLNYHYEQYASLDFIALDPISIPYRFSLVQDIEIAAFFASLFAWGRRDIIIAKTNQLMAMMDESPYDFIQNFEQKDLKMFKDFKHRTFNYEDLCFFLNAFQSHFKSFQTLEEAFAPKKLTEPTIEASLNHFFEYITVLTPIANRTLKHLSTPKKGSACKRLCMYHRWMVRKDSVDFGLWKNISSSQLIMPLDVHVMNSAIKLNLIPQNSKANWATATLLTKNLSEFDAQDPVKYDFSLFGMGINQKNIIPQ